MFEKVLTLSLKREMDDLSLKGNMLTQDFGVLSLFYCKTTIHADIRRRCQFFCQQTFDTQKHSSLNQAERIQHYVHIRPHIEEQ